MNPIGAPKPPGDSGRIVWGINLASYSMACTKMTPRKSTGPKGVPRHQLAPRNDGASSSSSRPDPQVEIQRISTELAQATRDRALDAIQVGEL